MTADNRPGLQQINTAIETNGRNLRTDLATSLAGFGVTVVELKGPFSSGVPFEVTPETAVLAATIAVTYAAMMVAVYRMAKHGILHRQHEELTGASVPISDFLKEMFLPSRLRKSA